MHPLPPGSHSTGSWALPGDTVRGAAWSWPWGSSEAKPWGICPTLPAPTSPCSTYSPCHCGSRPHLGTPSTVGILVHRTLPCAQHPARGTAQHAKREESISLGGQRWLQRPRGFPSASPAVSACGWVAQPRRPHSTIGSGLEMACVGHPCPFPTDAAHSRALTGESVVSVCGSGQGHSKGGTFLFQIPAEPRGTVRR